jgi:S-adenosyl methyltransferase
MVGGSYLTITHGNRDGGDRSRQTETGEVLDRTPTSIHLRGADELAALVAGMEIVEPGIVPVTDWHPEPDGDDSPQPGVIAVVARQP